MISRPHPLRNRNRNRQCTDPTESVPTESSLALNNTHTRSIFAPIPRPLLGLSTSSSTKKISTSTPPPAPTTTETLRPLNPLNIPEILYRIGQFLPLWYCVDRDITPHFRPKTLVRCSGVSRYWYNVMSPIIWYLYDDDLMRSLPQQVVRRNAHFIKVLSHRHIYGAGGGLHCQNLSRISTAPWFTGVEDQLKQNTRLEKFSWHTNGNYLTVRQSVYDALAGIKAGPNLVDTRGLTNLSILEFEGPTLDPRQLFPLLENHLPSLKVLILHDVTIMSDEEIRKNPLSSSSPPTSSIHHSHHQWNPHAQFLQIRELRMGRGITLAKRPLLDIVNHCPNLEKLVLEDMGKPWGRPDESSQYINIIINNNRDIKAFQDLFLHLVENLKQFNPKLKSLVYSPFIPSYAASPILLDDFSYANLIRSINPNSRVIANKDEGGGGGGGGGDDVISSHSSQEPNRSHEINTVGTWDPIGMATVGRGKRRDRGKDEEVEYSRPSFTADMDHLGSLTALALCNMERTIESIDLHIHSCKTQKTARSNMLNALQILTSCQGLKHFSMTHRNLLDPWQMVISPEDGVLLFNSPWACHRLETLVLDGFKRSADFNRYKASSSSSSGGSSNSSSTDATITMPPPLPSQNSTPYRQITGIVIRLQELLLLAGLGAPEKSPQITSIIKMGYRQVYLQDLDSLQEKLFHQLAKLQSLHQLTWNGDVFREFSKLKDY
ncbi:hypothetical protein BGZ76_002664 [Entomortierella beljakovae]|nr:hypothetical protein BGZ76_002664 [Entomortierella beljakovae]